MKQFVTRWSFLAVLLLAPLLFACAEQDALPDARTAFSAPFYARFTGECASKAISGTLCYDGAGCFTLKHGETDRPTARLEEVLADGVYSTVYETIRYDDYPSLPATGRLLKALDEMRKAPAACRVDAQGSDTARLVLENETVKAELTVRQSDAFPVRLKGRAGEWNFDLIFFDPNAPLEE